MSASEYAKSAGLKSLKEASDITGVSFQTLHNWYHNKPDLFRAVVLGCAEIKKAKQ